LIEAGLFATLIARHRGRNGIGGPTVEKVRIVTFPRDDAAFEAHVNVARAQLKTWDAATIVDRVRAAYPLVQARLADRAAHLDPLTKVWYVFRDGAIRPPTRDLSWADDPDVPRAVLSHEGLYCDVNDAAAALFGVSRDEVIGKPAGSFTSHEPEPELGDHLLGIAESEGQLRSTAVVTRRDGETWPIEFVVRPTREGDHVVSMRRLPSNEARSRQDPLAART
jgi:PAS domain S-box-containing protein